MCTQLVNLGLSLEVNIGKVLDKTIELTKNLLLELILSAKANGNEQLN